ncbi:MAG: LytTR family DNA-binding domain-containing protein [Parasphingorhabdus sp.]|uniref:LytR/AlgR family response regulator transcription factor n=1 Tax=Parasphingorhabdus sp. TaxID=2709688 RepID=UPI0032984E5E
MIAEEKFNVLIVDDEPLARTRIQSLCGRLPNVNHIDLAGGGREALDIVARDRPEIMLLDIDMPDLSGMEVADQCRQFSQPPEIIFTTAHSKYAADAFRFNAADYLLKPVKECELIEAFDRVSLKRQMHSGRRAKAEHRIWVQDGRGTVQISSADIEWIAADRDYMRLCLADRNYMVHEAMQSLLERLPPAMFLRIHRSAAVRRDFIRDIRRRGRRKYVILQDDTELTIGPSYVPTVMGAISG